VEDNKATVKIAGFGGQGVVLASAILGRAAILDGKYATQTASYGSESRGGECKAEVIISVRPIDYPLVDKVQTLVVMSQPALSKYVDDLVTGGTMLFDPDMLKERPQRKDITVIEVPAAGTADMLGRRIFENMVMLGALQAKTEVISEKSLLAAIREHVPTGTIESNLAAAHQGMKIVSSVMKGD
jgi:2-oxoglutarate ferredoxin oxidoreductase subunit gamma